MNSSTIFTSPSCDDVVDVALEQLLGAQRRLELVHEVLVDVLVEVVDAERLLDALDALLGGHDGALRLVDLVVAVALEALHDRGELVVELLRVVGAAGDDQRRAGLVDEDRVDLVDDRERGDRAGPARPCETAMLSRR